MRAPTVFFGLPLVVLLAAGCSESAGATCGDGTVFLDGTCVPGSQVCAPGTVLNAGECVPDGSQICSQGTEYDPDTGACIVVEGVCGEGTVYVDGQCVSLDQTPVGDVVEASEPNDVALEVDRAVVGFDLPTDGSVITLSGCVAPADFDGDEVIDADRDSFSFAVSEPALIDVTVDGQGGLSAGFVVTSEDEQLVADAWQRTGLNLVSDGSARTVYLPKAGTYYLTIADGRSILSGSPAGSAEACYLAQVARGEVPAASPAPAGGSLSDTYGDPRLIRFTATEGQVMFPTVLDESPAANPALVAFLNGEYHSSSHGPDAAELSFFGLSAGDEVLLVIDHERNYSIQDVPFLFGTFEPPTAELPSTVSDVTIENGEVTANLFMFEATAGDVLHVEFESGSTFFVGVATRSGQYVSQPCPVSIFGGGCSSTEFWLPIHEDGLYYLTLADLEAQIGTSSTVSLGGRVVVPQALALDTPVSVDLSSQSRAFYRVDASIASWLSFATSQLVNLPSVDIQAYDGAAPGALDLEQLAVMDFTSDGTAEQGWITEGLTGDYLIALSNTADEPIGGESLSLTLAARDYTDLGTVSAESPIASTSHAFEASDPRYFLVRAAAGAVVNVVATPEADNNARIIRLDRLEAAQETIDASADNTAEALEVELGTETFVAFSVNNVDSTGAIQIGVTATNPPYTVTPGSIAWNDVCGAGETMLVDADDELSANMSMSPMTFEFFGGSVTELVISSNGWLTFDGTYAEDPLYQPSPIPSDAEPNLIVAPYWQDLEAVRVCVEKSADQLTVQWEGVLWGTDITAQVQAILHASGAIDFVYGPDHADDGSSSSIGIEGPTGSSGVPYTEGIAAGTSLTFAP